MKIGGLQKMSLLDYPEKICAIVFTVGCNFRCPFCHNSALIAADTAEPLIAEDEFFSFLSRRVGRLDGVCVTGGEPLLQPDLADFLRRIKRLGFTVKLDTNGSFPERLEALLSESLLDYVAMDVKNAPEKYAKTVGITEISLNNIEISAKLLLDGDIPYEFRTTLVKEFHTPEDIRRIGRLLRGGKKYCLQNFSDSGRLTTNVPLNSFSEDEIMEMKRIADEFFQAVEIRS